MRPIAAIFSLIVAAAGWYYMFYSVAVRRLGAVEDLHVNAQRARLRRVGGFVMMCLAVCFFAGFFTVDWERPTRAFAAVWLTVFALLGVIVVLGLVDLRLTYRLRRRRP